MIEGGYMGKILRVDLTDKKMWEEKLDENFAKKYIGQLGFGARIMYDEVPPEIDAYHPENRLIFMTGPFTGTSVQSPSNFEVISLNPILGYSIAVANSHGFWGPYLKFAGFDGIVIQGAAEKPVYLWVHEGEYEIRDASRMWGKADTFETEDLIKKELGQEKASVVAIGPAGEHLVAGACVENEHGHIASKGNIGIVMGSKYLKAIAVYGKEKVPVANPDQFRELAKKWREESFQTMLGSLVDSLGTAGYTPVVHELGDLPVKNFLTGVFPEVEKLSGKYIREKFKLKPNPCYGCSLKHVHMVEVTEGPYRGFVGEEPEYEDFSNLGSNIGITDPGAVIWLTDYVDRLGLDGNWAGTVVGWAMEAYEKEILTKEDLRGLELNWGDEKAAAELLRRIAYREGIGDILALGLKKGPEKIGGKEATEFAVHFKGETQHAHDARAMWNMFLGLCVAGAGPRWEMGMDAETFDMGAGRFTVEGKAEAVRKGQMLKLFQDSLGVCWFGFATMDTMVKAYTALTGWPLSVGEAYVIGERIANLQRAFNVRHGFKPEFDLDVSPRLLEPPPDGGAKGKTIAPYLEDMVKEYNRLMDWDWETGRPSKNKLKELGLEDVSKDLWR
ncbi:MAG: aldehyde ferredoxin oxidoreductase family protein [Candidatus Jordarchaeaceae archaeon]